jgi:hypothetical protein
VNETQLETLREMLAAAKSSEQRWRQHALKGLRPQIALSIAEDAKAQSIALAAAIETLEKHDALVRAAASLSGAVVHYQATHDKHGGDHLLTGHAWDQMRRVRSKLDYSLSAAEAARGDGAETGGSL